ncbi:putative Ca2+ channel [Heterostelium album PN500]|uniref:Putative Ca2+ channel n=1 Tax=Heterostelium pallidum (strain ATCC 26659 / Pp 5 / PN500) TaxID=670386 RepID=D3AZC5_HETP5|nr:putative Ca2+ channel [Heterostelium album PN500]EFA85508.1 putative Ca2+ channel [Heterostelium album PN500]|eukprot:XP_020437616.1 putative Ca2+ channel [Heterostelium album PN500]
MLPTLSPIIPLSSPGDSIKPKNPGPVPPGGLNTVKERERMDKIKRGTSLKSRRLKIKEALADKNDHEKATMLAAIEIQRRAKLIKDLIKHIVFFVAFLTIVILQRNSVYVYQIGWAIKSDLLFNGDQPFTEIKTQAQFNSYLTEQFAPQVSSMTYENPYSMNDIVGGTVRIRQLRVRPNSCPNLSLNRTCYSPTYNSYTRDKRDIVGTNGTIYKFTPNTGGPMVFGYNQYTRAVIISFVAFTLNYESRVTVAYMLVEYSASGILEPYYALRTYRVNMYSSHLDGFRAFLEVLFLLFLIYYIYNFINEARIDYHLGRIKYFLTSFWNLLDIINISLFVASVILFLIFLSDKNANNIPLDTAGYPSHMEALGETALVYYQLSAITFKTFRYLIIHRRLYAIWITISHARLQLMTFTIMFLIMMIGFLISAWLTFGHDLDYYNGFLNSLGTSLQFIMGNPPSFQDMTYTNRALGPIKWKRYSLSLSFLFRRNIYDISAICSILMEKRPGLIEEKGITPERMFDEIQNLGLGFKFDEAQYYTDLAMKVYTERKKFLQEILANKQAGGVSRNKLLQSVQLTDWADEQEKAEKKKEKQRKKEERADMAVKIDRLLQLLGDSTYILNNNNNTSNNNLSNNNNSTNSLQQPSLNQSTAGLIGRGPTGGSNSNLNSSNFGSNNPNILTSSGSSSSNGSNDSGAN